MGQDFQDWLDGLKGIAAERNFGAGFEHADAVTQLTLSLYSKMTRLRIIPRSASDRFLITAAGYLHDVGFPPHENHHVNGFNWLKNRLDQARDIALPPKADQSIILYCVLWHRAQDYGVHPDVQLPDVDRARRLAALLRIADGLSAGGRPVRRVSLRRVGRTLLIEACPFQKGDSLDMQVHIANEKKDLLEQVLLAKVDRVDVRRCSHIIC